MIDSSNGSGKPDYQSLITRGTLGDVLALAARCETGLVSSPEASDSEVATVPAPAPALCWDPCRACGDINPHCRICGARNYTVPVPADELVTMTPAPQHAA